MLPDVVYPVRPGQPDDPASLRYSMRTLSHHFPHGRVFVVGHLPRWVDPDAVVHVPTKQQTGNTSKFPNMKRQLRGVMDSDVSEEFVMMNDDFFFLADVDSLPLLNKGLLSEHLENCAGPYREGLSRCLEILRRWGHDEPLNTAVHAPMPIVKSRLSEVMERAWSEGHRDGFYRVLYGAGLESEYMVDPKVRGDEMPRKAWRFASSEPGSWSGRFGDWIRNRYWRPSTYEVTR